MKFSLFVVVMSNSSLHIPSPEVKNLAVCHRWQSLIEEQKTKNKTKKKKERNYLYTEMPYCITLVHLMILCQMFHRNIVVGYIYIQITSGHSSDDKCYASYLRQNVLHVVHPVGQ